MKSVLGHRENNRIQSWSAYTGKCETFSDLAETPTCMTVVAHKELWVGCASGEVVRFLIDEGRRLNAFDAHHKTTVSAIEEGVDCVFTGRLRLKLI